MSKKILKYVLVFGCTALVLAIFFEFRKYQEDKPWCKNCNVVLISIDTLGSKHLPCYGYDKNTAPNLCQFGKDNILFTNSYSQSHWTRPSQTSVLTGLHMSTHGVMVEHADELDKKYKTIAEILKANNYQTIYSGPVIDDGSWAPSVIRGFDYKFEQNYRNGKPLDHWYKALDILEQNQKNGQPTFMYLHTYYVHAPYITGKENLKFVSQSDRDKYPQIPLNLGDYRILDQKKWDFIVSSLENRIKQSTTAESLRINTDMLTKIKKAKTLKEAQRIFDVFPEYEIGGYVYDWYMASLGELGDNSYAASLYDERINQMDNEIKGFLDRINNEFSKDTIVIIYSDHGEALGERSTFGHCYEDKDCLYNETIRVPLIIKIPGIKNKKINQIVQGIDIYPTISKIVGIKIPSYVEGSSLVKMIRNGTKVHDYIVSEQGLSQKVIVDKKWKAYFKDYKNITSDNVELYNLENDLYEQKNVAKDNPDILKIRTDQLNEFVAKSKNVTPPKYNFPDWIDNVKREKLIKEGYF